MTELEKVWQDIDRAIGYIKGFMSTIYALDEVQPERDIVSIESIIEYENVVKGLATQTARLRELYEKNAEVSFGSVRIGGNLEYLECDALGNQLGGDDGGADIRDGVLGLCNAGVHDCVSRQVEEADGE